MPASVADAVINAVFTHISAVPEVSKAGVDHDRRLGRRAR
jgi:hypothetical protein